MRFEVIVADHSLDFREDLRQFPVVELDVAEDQLLLDIARTALQQLELEWPHSYSSFVTRPDEEGRRLHCSYLLAHVASDGVLSWTDRTLEGVKVADLLRSRDEGVFEGDPLALLVELPTMGDGVLPDSWEDLVRWLIMFGASWQGLKSVVEATRGLATLVERSRRIWQARHSKPWAFFPFILARKEWDYGQLSRYLDIPLGVTLDLLGYLGYEQDASQPRLYRQSSDAEKAALRDAVSTHVAGMPSGESRRFLWEVQGKPGNWQPP